MQKGNNKRTEEFLERFSYKPAPSELKEKTLSKALQRQKSNHVMMAYLWKGFVGCLFLLTIVIAIDATINHAQNKHYASILQREQEPLDFTEEEHSIVKDIILDLSDSTKSEAKIKFFGLWKIKNSTRREWDRRKSIEEELE
jgi:hypothetical protein